MGPTGGSQMLDRATKIKIHDLMVKTRCTEETAISMNKQGEGFFWIGGAGEEAFGVALGLQIKKGQGPAYDYLHLHYRGAPIAIAMGAEPIDQVRQMRATSTDRYSGGRQFVEHFAIPEWNIVPVTPTIETQYLMAPGTAHVQRRFGGDGITVVTGGDAGTAEGDFHCCLNWASRPGEELPLLIIVTHNKFGISTPSGQVQAQPALNKLAEPFGIRNSMHNGNDVEEIWTALEEAIAYIRKERKPYCLQANVSRIFGHSSATGANRVPEVDCITVFEDKLVRDGIMTRTEIDGVWKKWKDHLKECLAQVRQEPLPDGSDIWRHVFAEPATV